MPSLVVVILPTSDRGKAPFSIEAAGREIIDGHFEYETLRAVPSRSAANSVEKRRSDSYSPSIWQNTERQKFAFVAEGESHREPCRLVVLRGDQTEKPSHACDLQDGPSIPRILRKTGPVEQRKRFSRGWRDRLEVPGHGRRALGVLTSGGRK
jgi:hypothetical protein